MSTIEIYELAQIVAESDLSEKDTSENNIQSIQELLLKYKISIKYLNDEKIMILNENNECLYSKALPTDGNLSQKKERALLLFIAELLGKNAAKNKMKQQAF